MRKLIAIAALAAAIPCLAQAQTAENGHGHYYFDGYAPCTDPNQFLCFYKGPPHPLGFSKVFWGPMGLGVCEGLLESLPIKPRSVSGCLGPL